MPKSKIENGVLSGANDRKSEIVVLADRAALTREAASRFVLIANQAIAARGRFAVALSGGSTPRDLYQLLATREFSSQLDWSRVHLFWGDERSVPPDHPDSNFRMANEALISRVPIPQSNVHRIYAELNPDAAAREYERTLEKFFTFNTPSPLSRGRDGEGDRQAQPRFDLILLGLGEDAHTASLFPRTPALQETTRWVTANYIEKLKMYRITLSPPILNAAENIVFLVAGADKAKAVFAVLRGAYRPDDFPAKLVQPTNGHAVWLLDQAASAKLGAKS